MFLQRVSGISGVRARAVGLRTLGQQRRLKSSGTRVPGAEMSGSFWSNFTKKPQLVKVDTVPNATTHTLRAMLEILRNKQQPQLIYEAQSHNFWFKAAAGICLSMGLFTLSTLDFATSGLISIYQNDNDKLELTKNIAITVGLTSFGAGVLGFVMYLPTRLVKRIYLDNAKQAVKLVHYRFLGLGSQETTVPLANLVRTSQRKIFTGSGDYGVTENATFCFILKDNRSSKFSSRFVVDRDGWFWGDGRVFDVLFGKLSYEDAEIDQGLIELRRMSKERKDALVAKNSNRMPIKRDFLKRQGDKQHKVQLSKVKQVVSQDLRS